MTDAAWCRGVEGQEHAWRFVQRTDAPPCQPLRRWLREACEAELVKGSLSPLYVLILSEGWECFHREECTRCRKRRHRVIGRAECPVARGDQMPP